MILRGLLTLLLVFTLATPALAQWDLWTSIVNYDGVATTYNCDRDFNRGKQTRDNAGNLVAVDEERWADFQSAFLPAMTWVNKLALDGNATILASGRDFDGTDLAVVRVSGGDAVSVYTWNKVTRQFSIPVTTNRGALPGADGSNFFDINAALVHDGFICLTCAWSIDGNFAGVRQFYSQDRGVTWTAVVIPRNSAALDVGTGLYADEGIGRVNSWNKPQAYPIGGIGAHPTDYNRLAADICSLEYMASAGNTANVTSVTNNGSGFCRFTMASRFTTCPGTKVTTATNTSVSAYNGIPHNVTATISDTVFDTDVSYTSDATGGSVNKSTQGGQAWVFRIVRDSTSDIWTVLPVKILISEWRDDIIPFVTTTKIGSTYHYHSLALSGTIYVLAVGDTEIHNAFHLLELDDNTDEGYSTATVTSTMNWHGQVPEIAYSGTRGHGVHASQLTSLCPATNGDVVSGGDVDNVLMGRISKINSTSDTPVLRSQIFHDDDVSGGSTPGITTGVGNWYPSVGWLFGGFGGTSSYPSADPFLIYSWDSESWAYLTAGSSGTNRVLPLGHNAMRKRADNNVYVAQLPVRPLSVTPLCINPGAVNLAATAHGSGFFSVSTSAQADARVQLVTYDAGDARYEYSGIGLPSGESAGTALALQPTSRPPSMSDLTKEGWSESPYDSNLAGFWWVQNSAGTVDVSEPTTVVAYQYATDPQHSPTGFLTAFTTSTGTYTYPWRRMGNGQWNPICMLVPGGSLSADARLRMRWGPDSTVGAGNSKRQLMHYAGVYQTDVVPWASAPGDSDPQPNEVEVISDLPPSLAKSAGVILKRSQLSNHTDMPLLSMGSDPNNYLLVWYDASEFEVAVSCVVGGSEVATAEVSVGTNGFQRTMPLEIIVADNGVDDVELSVTSVLNGTLSDTAEGGSLQSADPVTITIGNSDGTEVPQILLARVLYAASFLDESERIAELAGGRMFLASNLLSGIRRVQVFQGVVR